MKKLLIFLLVLFIAGILMYALIYFFSDKPKTTGRIEKSKTTTTIKNTMQISSPSFKNNQSIPSKFTCTGENINPALEFADVPQQTRSLVLIVDDPDAPVGTWVHWVVFNILPSIIRIGENTKPAVGTEGITSFGKPGYGGPCPPSGTHRYFFKLYALDKMLDIRQTADKKAVEVAMQGHILSQAQLIGLYSKK